VTEYHTINKKSAMTEVNTPGKKDIWRRHHGSSNQRIGGVALFLLGMAMIVYMNFPWFMGGFFATVGLIAAVGRESIIVDRRIGKIIKAWGLIIPLYRKTYDLAAFDRILITSKERVSHGTKPHYGGSVKYTEYMVKLAGREDSVLIEKKFVHNHALILGLELERFIGLKLIDKSPLFE
jgi:hypothetical protein